jgi:hypothetical protein
MSEQNNGSNQDLVEQNNQPNVMRKKVLHGLIRKYFLKGVTGDATWFYEGGVLSVVAQDTTPPARPRNLAACIQVKVPGLKLPERFTITPLSSKALLKALKGMPAKFGIAVSKDLRTMTLTSDGIERAVMLDKVSRPVEEDRHQKARLDAYAKDIVSFHNNVVENNRLCEEAGRAAGRSAIENAIRAGETLVSAKKALGHGNWLAWLEANCGNISDTTAQKYMRLYDANEKHPELFKDLPTLTHAYLACGAIKSSAKKKTPLRTPEAAPASAPPTPVSASPVEPATPPAVSLPPVATSITQTPAPYDGVMALEVGLRDGFFTLEHAAVFLVNHMKDLNPSLLKPLVEYYAMMTTPVSLNSQGEPQPMDIAA